MIGYLPGPALPYNSEPDSSEIYQEVRDIIPRTVDFTGSFAAGAIYPSTFSGSSFFNQYTLGRKYSVNSDGQYLDGDYFEMCGTSTYEESVKEHTRLNYYQGPSGLLTFTSNYRLQQHVELVFPDADPWNWSFQVITDDLVDELGYNFISELITAPDKSTFYERVDGFAYHGDGPPYTYTDFAPVIRPVGGTMLTKSVTLSTLEHYAEQWLARAFLFPDDVLDDAGPVGLSATQTNEGYYAETSVGLVMAPTNDQLSGYDMQNAQFQARYEVRKNQPRVWSRDGRYWVGEGIYRFGYGGFDLSGLITQKIWKDQYGVFDLNQQALINVPWSLGANGFAYAAPIESGVVNRGFFVSADGGTYRVTFDNPSMVVEVSPGMLNEYQIAGSDYLSPLLVSVEQYLSNAWVLIPDPIAVIGDIPRKGIKMMHGIKARYGQRWGFQGFTGNDRFLTKTAKRTEST